MSTDRPGRAMLGVRALRVRHVHHRALALHPPDGRTRATPPRRRHERHRSRGQSIVEFAILLPVLMLILLIAVDFGRVFFTTVQLGNAVREAANYGATNPVDPQGMLARANRERNSQGQAGEQGALTYPQNLATTCATPAGVTIACASSPGGGGAGNTLTVTLNEPFSFFTPFIGGFFGGDLQISSSATVAVLNSAAGGGTGNPSGCAAPTIATFTVTATDLTVVLDPAGSSPDSGLCAISGYNYDFGDGNSDVGGTVPTTYTYKKKGTYTITLEVTNQGGSATATQTITLPPAAPTPTPTPTTTPTPTPTATPPGPTPTPTPTPSPTPTATPCTPPTAAFSASPVGNSGKVNFNDQSTYPAGCPITVWLWDFGDGTPLSNAQNPQHTYANKNAFYTVVLTATNSAGQDSITHTVHP